jgi:hypothetical protein
MSSELRRLTGPAEENELIEGSGRHAMRREPSLAEFGSGPDPAPRVLCRVFGDAARLADTAGATELLSLTVAYVSAI